MALSEVDVADVHLGEVGDDLHGDVSRAAGEGEEPGNEFAVGEALERSEQFVRHGRVVAPERGGMGPRRGERHLRVGTCSFHVCIVPASDGGDGLLVPERVES
jgi:hypothetical protein